MQAVWQVPTHDARHPLQDVVQLPLHIPAQPDEQEPQVADVEVFSQFDAQAFEQLLQSLAEEVPSQFDAQALEQPWLHADEPHPFSALPTHDWLQEVPQPDWAVPMQEFLHPDSGSSEPHDDSNAEGTASPTKIGITL